MQSNKVLLRNEYSGEAREYLEKVSHLFYLLSDRGLRWFNEIGKTDYITEENNAIVFLYRNAVAYIDAIAEAARVPSVENIRILARTFFEVKCYMEYIFKENTYQRAVAYQVYYIRDRIKSYKRLDPSTASGKSFRKDWQKDRVFAASESIQVDTKTVIENLKSQLVESPYFEINQRYEEFERKKRKYNWYTFDETACSLIDLCKYIDQKISYEIFFRQWSGVVHSTSVYQDNFVTVGSKRAMGAIRSINGYQNTIRILLPFVCDFYDFVFSNTTPNYHKRFIRFYRNIFLPKKYEIETYNLTQQPADYD